MFGLVTAALVGSHLFGARIERGWESEVFYHIFPRSFRDSNGDRIGDFKGIQQGLGAIEKLGCTTIMLNPVYKARVYHNYFADDWFDVNPKFGTLADFRNLCAAAHAKGIRVVLDMEPQYAADGHPWYKAAADPKSKAADYFTGKLDTSPMKSSPWYNGVKVRIANVNLNNEDVRAAIHKNFHFWCEQGVDGFRIDHMMDDLDWQGKSKDLYANLWGPIEVEIKKQYPGAFFIGEQADWLAFHSTQELFQKTPTDAVFNFRLQVALLTLKRSALEGAINEYRYFTPAGRMQANFLENHDMARFASAETDPAKQRCAAAIMIAAKGIPSIYYGQELGMKGLQGHGLTDGNDIPVRLAYRWGATLKAKGTATWYAGSGPWASTRFSSDHDGVSYEEEDGKPDSLLNWYRKLIHVRRASSPLSLGDQFVTDVGQANVLAFDRSLHGSTVRVFANLSGGKAVFKSSLGGVDLIAGKVVRKGSILKLAPWQVVYLQVAR